MDRSPWGDARRAAMLVLETLPPVRRVRRWDYERRRFRHWPNACLGVFADFDEARRAAPGRTGYDHPEMAGMYDDRIGHVRPEDYPAIYWLQRVLPRASSVFDLGGHVGIAYYSYARYLDHPPELRWVVCDVPAVIERGAALARERGAAQLRFTGRFEDAAGCDVLLAEGSLQYLEPDLATLLAGLAARPRHIIVTKTPMLAGRQFVTLQNTHHSYNPYRVFDRQRFVDSLLGIGYELVDSWEDPGLSCRVPYRPGHSVGRYTGLYLRSR
jgi:putative methyltransferase (TIGR04325 family)